MAIKIVERTDACQLKMKDSTLDAMLHLIEIVYDDRFTFWNGVMEIPVDKARMFGVLDQILDQRFTVGVRLSDGRKGYFDLTDVEMPGENLQLAGVGAPK
jgi:hypothetical protein